MDEVNGPQWQPDLEFTLCDRSEGLEAVLGIRYCDDESTELSKSAQYRLLCHALVHRLPEPALEEAAESLNELHEFYLNRPALPAMPAPAEFTKATITGRYTAPLFPVLEE